MAQEQELGHLSHESLNAILNSFDEDINYWAQKYQDRKSSDDLDDLREKDRTEDLVQTLKSARELFLEFLHNIENPNEISNAISAVRHRVYRMGMISAKEIEATARRRGQIPDGKRKDMSPDEYQKLLIEKTRECFKKLGEIKSEQRRDKELGLVKARYFKPDMAKIKEKYFLENGEEIQPNAIINDNTPLNDLYWLIKLAAENKDENRKDTYERTAMVAKEHFISRLVTDNPKMKTVAMKFFTPRYYEAIIKQMPDTLSEGKIGGKSTGVLLAYSALEQNLPEFDEKFAKGHRMSVENLSEALGKVNFKENNSSFIGSEVFESILEHNKELGGLVRELKTYYNKDEQKDDEKKMKTHERIKELVGKARFPDHIERQLKIFYREYLQGKPIIVRSSSELEDRIGAAFAGKYDSLELANSSEDFKTNYVAFLEALKKVYASVFSPDVMEYRRQKGLLHANEEMGILIQELNGQKRGKYFYPDLSAVGFSHALQSTGHDPLKGSFRIAAGLGESLVEDGEGAFAMFEKPLTNKASKKTQENMKVMDLETSQKIKISHSELFKNGGLSSALITHAMQIYNRDSGRLEPASTFGYEGNGSMDFEQIVENKYGQNVILKIEYIVQKLKYALGYNVDCEFTIDYNQKEKTWEVKLVQCRPQHIPENLRPSEMPVNIPKERVVLDSKNALNGTCCANIDSVLYVEQQALDGSIEQLSAVANYIGKVNRVMKNKRCIVMAPGRFGSQAIEDRLGIPVRFSHFSNMKGVIEVFDDKKSFEPSYGTHFSQDYYDNEMVNVTCKTSELGDFINTAKHCEKTSEGEETPGPPENIKHLIKFIDINSEFKPDKTSPSSNRKWVMHIAQNNTGEDPETRKARMYIAKEHEDLPITS